MSEVVSFCNSNIRAEVKIFDASSWIVTVMNNSDNQILEEKIFSSQDQAYTYANQRIR